MRFDGDGRKVHADAESFRARFAQSHVVDIAVNQIIRAEQVADFLRRVGVNQAGRVQVGRVNFFVDERPVHQVELADLKHALNQIFA